MTKLEKNYYSVPEVAELLNQSRQWIHLKVRLNEIPAEKMGRAWMIKKEDVEKLLKEK
jgi:excisionase family DNA binding protein